MITTLERDLDVKFRTKIKPKNIVRRETIDNEFESAYLINAPILKDFALHTSNMYVIEAYNKMISNTNNSPIQY